MLFLLSVGIKLNQLALLQMDATGKMILGV
jgi:hypothetical protein